MLEQLNLFTGPTGEADLKFVKMKESSIAPTQDKDGDWVLYASEDILIRSDCADPVYCGLRILVDDKNVEARIYNIQNKFYYPQNESGPISIRHGFNEKTQIGMYVRTRQPAPREKLNHFGWGMMDQDEIDRLPEYRTIMEKKVTLMDGTIEDYHKEVPKNSVLIKRGTAIFIVHAYRRANVKMTEEILKKNVAAPLTEDCNGYDDDEDYDDED